MRLCDSGMLVILTSETAEGETRSWEKDVLPRTIASTHAHVSVTLRIRGSFSPSTSDDGGHVAEGGGPSTIGCYVLHGPSLGGLSSAIGIEFVKLPAGKLVELVHREAVDNRA